MRARNQWSPMSIKRIDFRHIHDNQDGSISIIAVFAVMLFTMLLGMVINVGRQVDGKIRLQNAADAGTYSGGIMLVRGINTLAFTNHLLCEILATTAFLREAGQHNAESYVPSILAAWEKEGPVLAESGFPKFQTLGPAIIRKVPLEQELVRSYSAWAAAASERILPLLEEILAEEMIPQYQRAVVAAFPDIAQAAAMEVTNRDSEPERGRGRMLGAMWRGSGQLVGGTREKTDPTLPVVDPESGTSPAASTYADQARQERKEYATHYLDLWNNKTLIIFDREAKMSQFSALWRSFTCGQLHKLLYEEYFDKNLPMVIRTKVEDVHDGNAYLDQNFTFVGIAYWKELPEILPGLFKNPLAHDAVAYAQVRVFVPRARIEWWRPSPDPVEIGGVPGEFPHLPVESASDADEGTWKIRRQPSPQQWDLWNQHWTCQLTPTTVPTLTSILRTQPQLVDFSGTNFALPDLGNISTEDIGKISPH